MRAPATTTGAAARRGRPDADADVIVVGAGPAGSTAATHLARAGLDVLLLERSAFPRDKVCGDGFTPRGVKQIVDLGIDCSRAAGWVHNRGLRVVGGGVGVELDWPTSAAFPDFGAVRPRADFDELLARNAERAGARLHENTTVTEAVTDERTGRVVGVAGHEREGSDRRPVAFRAPLTLSCDGVSARVAQSVGISRRAHRPMGVAVRRYFTSPRTDDDYLETHLELWDRTDAAHPTLLPGYGWIFGMGDGTVNVGLGVLSTERAAAGRTDYRGLLASWVAGLPAEWGLSEETAVGPVGGAGLPMGFTRTPQYRPGMLLVGDSAGTVNPLNGEGIAYAMESAVLAAGCAIQGMAREGASREAALAAYPARLGTAFGRYYRLAAAVAALVGNPSVMRVARRHGLPRRAVLAVLLKWTANLYDPSEGGLSDRVLAALTRLSPSLN